MKLLGMMALVLAFVLGPPMAVPQQVQAAVEIRCTELGVNCICSAPMQTTTFTRPFGGPWVVPADSLTKPCSNGDANYAGGLIGRNQDDLVTVASGEMINALPSGHIAGIRAVQTPSGGIGLYNVGVNMTRYPSAPRARSAIRMYVYWSPTFTWTDGNLPDCGNSGKLFQLSETGGGIISWTDGKWNTHGWGFNGALWSIPTGNDCCGNQPGASATAIAMNNASFRNKWYSFEIIYRNLPGPPLILEVYMRNITDNGPEFKIMDSSIPTAQPPGQVNQWTSSQYATTLSLQSGGWTHMFDLFRNATASPHDNCAGYYGYTHYMYAAWSTDAGQRIGPATEVEGGGGGPPPPPLAPGRPTGVTVTQAFGSTPVLVAGIPSSVVAVMLLVLVALLRGRARARGPRS